MIKDLYLEMSEIRKDITHLAYKAYPEEPSKFVWHIFHQFEDALEIVEAIIKECLRPGPGYEGEMALLDKAPFLIDRLSYVIDCESGMKKECKAIINKVFKLIEEDKGDRAK